MSVVKEIFANAFPEKTFFFTTNPLAISGKATAPDTSPAFNLTDKRGAIDFPSVLFGNMMILLPTDSATCAITFV